MTASLTVQQLKDRFFLEQAPYWWAYDARKRNECRSKFRSEEDIPKEELLEWSWLQLEELISVHPSGHFRIVLKKSPNENTQNAPTYYVRWGQQEAGQIASSQSIAPVGNQWGQMMQMQQQFFEQLLRRERELAELRYENRRLEDDLNSAETPSIQHELLREGVGLLKGFVSRPRIQQPGALGTAGQRPQELPPESSSGSGRPVSVDHLIQDAGATQKALPEYHVNDIYRAIRLFAEQQPDQARTYLGMLIQQLNEQ